MTPDLGRHLVVPAFLALIGYLLAGLVGLAAGVVVGCVALAVTWRR